MMTFNELQQVGSVQEKQDRSKTDPCGIPKSTADGIELDVAVRTCCVRPLRYDVNHAVDDLLAKTVRRAQPLKEHVMVDAVECR